MKPEAFRNKAVIVTGASAGIGKALVLQLAEQGAKVAIAARREERLAQVAEECRHRGGDALVIPTDVSDETLCKALVLRLKEYFPAAELVFDAYSPFMRWAHNLRVIRKRVGAHLNWDLKHSRDLEGWGAGLRLLDERFPFQFPEVDQRRALRARLFSPLVAKGIGVFHYQI